MTAHTLQCCNVYLHAPLISNAHNSIAVQHLICLQELPSIQQQIDDSVSTFAVLETSHQALLDESADVFWQLRHWPNAVQEELAAARERIWGYRNRYQLQLQEDQRQLQHDLQQLQVRNASRCICTHPCT
jgi:tRNA/tmRNA/rRNA uracil-C5-methylase (TrmA/RlmC/RlmD family)